MGAAAMIGLDEGTARGHAGTAGHSDIRVTRGYTHVSSALAADGAERSWLAMAPYSHGSAPIGSQVGSRWRQPLLSLTTPPPDVFKR
jgi:hypothetical protein